MVKVSLVSVREHDAWRSRRFNTEKSFLNKHSTVGSVSPRETPLSLLGI
jgi:hypothetical protein